MDKKILGIVIVAFGLVFGLALDIVAGYIEDSYWPLLVLLPLCMVPIPVFLLGSIGGSDGVVNFDTGGILNVDWPSTGQFITGSLIISTWAIHAIFYHLDMITLRSFFMVMVGNVCIYLGAGLGGYFVAKEEEGGVF